MELPDPILGALEIALNRYLALDAEALRGCAALDGRLIALHLREFGLTAWLQPGTQGVQVLPSADRPADVTLSGSLPAFARLLWPQTEQAELLLSGAVEIDGDSELAQEFANLLRRVNFLRQLAVAVDLDRAARRRGRARRQPLPARRLRLRPPHGGGARARHGRVPARGDPGPGAPRRRAEMDGRRGPAARGRGPAGGAYPTPAAPAGSGAFRVIRGLGQLRRLWQIRRVVARYGLGELLGEGGRRLGLWPSAAMRARPLGVRIREALEELGPVFVKLGQALSTRPDLLPPDIASELAKLQDEVPPFPGEVARALVEKAYGFPLEQVFE
jgi:predicted lipid carrier protein YhbT